MRLLFVASQASLPPMDGADSRAWHLYECLVRDGMEGSFLGRMVLVHGLGSPFQHSARRAWREFKPAAGLLALVTGRDYWQLKHLLPGARRTVKVLASERYDAVITSCLYSLPLARSFIARGTPLVVDTHNYDPAWYGSLEAASRNRVLRMLCRRAVRNSQRALASLPAGTVLTHVSEADAARYQRHRPDLTHAVVENGTTIRRRQTAPNYATPGKQLLMFVGSLSARMNQDALRHFAESFWPVLRNIARFRVVGSRPPAGLKQLCRQTDWELHANVSETQLEELYAEAHYAVLPFAYGEGSKLKLFEACGRAVPVLSTAAGVCGVPRVPSLVTVADGPSVWADRIQRRIQPDPSDTRSLAAFAEEFSWAKLSRKLARIIQGQLETPQGVCHSTTEGELCSRIK